MVRVTSTCIVPNGIYLAEWVRFDLWELVFHIVWIHGSDLFSGGSAEDFDDFNQLIYT